MPHLPRELVILVHGLGAPASMMALMQKRFAAAGYDTFNFGYPSLVGQIQQHGRTFAAVLAQHDADDRIATLHIVTHSLGGIVTRCALHHAPPPRKLGRIVMLAPPNRGSPVATRIRRFVGRLIPPVEQLSQHEGSWVRSLPPLEGVELGIIAGAQDWVVGLPNTHLPGQSDHIILPGFHSPLVWQRDAFDQALAFIREGRFRYTARHA